MRDYGRSHRLAPSSRRAACCTGEIAGSIIERRLLRSPVNPARAHLHEMLETAHGAAHCRDRRRARKVSPRRSRGLIEDRRRRPVVPGRTGKAHGRHAQAKTTGHHLGKLDTIKTVTIAFGYV